MNSHCTNTRFADVRRAAFAVIGVLLLSGCDGGQSPQEMKKAQEAAAQQAAQPAKNSSAPAPAATATPSASASPTSTPSQTASPTPAASAATPTSPPATTANAIATTEKQAGVGVGKKGGYDKGFVATPLASYWATREKLAFMVQIPHAMNLFKAMEGRAPKDNDEFMEKIIKANQIKLPELPEGSRYRYDPKTELLMVDSPKTE
jgi:hypothetical protein